MGEIFYPGDLVQVVNGDSVCRGWIGKVASNQDTEGKVRVDFDEKSQGYFDATDLIKLESVSECCIGDRVCVTSKIYERFGQTGVVTGKYDAFGIYTVTFQDQSSSNFDITELCRVSKKEEKEGMTTMFHESDLVSVIDPNNKYYGKTGLVTSVVGDGLVSVDFCYGSGPELFHPDKLQRRGAASAETNSTKEFTGLREGDSMQLTTVTGEKADENVQEVPMGFSEGDFVKLTVSGEKYSDMVGVVASLDEDNDVVRVRYPDHNTVGFYSKNLRKCNADETEQDEHVQQFSTGAVRDVQDNKPRPDLVSPFFILRLGEHLRKGAEHYGEHNWEKGIPNSRCFASLMRHLNQWASGETNEDHLAAAAFNLMAIIHNEEVAKKNAELGLKHKDLLVDIPNYFQYQKEEEEDQNAR